MGIEAVLATTAIIGAGISAYSQYKEGQDAADASRYNADISRKNAELIDQSGALDAERQRKQISVLRGKQKAAYAGAGVELTGSPLDVMINTAAEGELDAQIIEWNTKVRSSGAMSQAAYDEKLAGIYERSGVINASGTLLRSAASIGSDYIGSSTTPKATQIGSYTGYKYSGGKPYTGY